jgi:hypothetical protein
VIRAAALTLRIFRLAGGLVVEAWVVLERGWLATLLRLACRGSRKQGHPLTNCNASAQTTDMTPGGTCFQENPLMHPRG